MAQSQCCPLQNTVTGLPSFGVSMLSLPSLLASSSSPHSMLQLLSLPDQELQEQMARGHSYAFNMGNNHVIPFQDFHEAVKALMERNMPDVLHNRQTKAVFMPEAHLPNMPRVVDEPRYQARKEHLNAAELQFLGMKQGRNFYSF